KKPGTTQPISTPGCANNPAGGPRQMSFTIADHGTDLDTGFSGVSHNFPVIAGAKLTLCMSECDASTNPVCKAAGPTGEGSINGPTFGPPLPLFAGGVPVCLVNRFRDPMVQASANVSTGEIDGQATPIVLLSDVYSTFPNQLCPKCAGGTCDSGAKKGSSCTVEGSILVRSSQADAGVVYDLSAACPPGADQGSKAGTVTVSLPVTTGTATLSGSKPCPGQPRNDNCGSSGCTVECADKPDVKGGLNQWCCGAGGAA